MKKSYKSICLSSLFALFACMNTVCANNVIDKRAVAIKIETLKTTTVTTEKTTALLVFAEEINKLPSVTVADMGGYCIASKYGDKSDCETIVKDTVKIHNDGVKNGFASSTGLSKKCGIPELSLAMFQYRGDDEFLYSTKGAYDDITDKPGKQVTGKGFIFECDNSYCDYNSVVTMAPGHVFKGSVVNEQKIYMCDDSDTNDDRWRPVSSQIKNCSEYPDKKAGGNVVRYTSDGNTYLVWPSELNVNSAAACIEGAAPAQQTTKINKIGMACSAQDLSGLDNAISGVYRAMSPDGAVMCHATSCNAGFTPDAAGNCMPTNVSGQTDNKIKNGAKSGATETKVKPSDDVSGQTDNKVKDDAKSGNVPVAPKTSKDVVVPTAPIDESVKILTGQMPSVDGVKSELPELSSVADTSIQASIDKIVGEPAAPEIAMPDVSVPTLYDDLEAKAEKERQKVYEEAEREYLGMTQSVYNKYKKDLAKLPEEQRPQSNFDASAIGDKYKQQLADIDADLQQDKEKALAKYQAQQERQQKKDARDAERQQKKEARDAEREQKAAERAAKKAEQEEKKARGDQMRQAVQMALEEKKSQEKQFEKERASYSKSMQVASKSGWRDTYKEYYSTGDSTATLFGEIKQRADADYAAKGGTGALQHDCIYNGYDSSGNYIQCVFYGDI